MKSRKQLAWLLVILVLIFISGFISRHAIDWEICIRYSTCSSNLVFAYGKPIQNLFLPLIALTIFLLPFSQKVIKRWFPRILYTIWLPIVATFVTPMYCGGFLGCLFEREQVAQWLGIVYAALFIVLIVIDSLIGYSREQKVKSN